MATKLPPLAKAPQAASRFESADSFAMIPTGGRASRGGHGAGMQGTRGPPPKTLRTVEIESQDPILDPPLTDLSARQQTCVELLMTGHVESFLELFELTSKDLDHSRIGESDEKLRAMHKNLAAAEAAQRKGDFKGAYAARRRLAEFFEKAGELKNALHARHEALTVAAQLPDKSDLAEAHFNLAQTHERLWDVRSAQREYKLMLGVASKERVTGTYGTDTAASALLRISAAIADLLALDGKESEAVQELHEGEALAAQVSSTPTLGAVFFRLGKLYERKGEFLQSVAYFEKFMALSREVSQRGDTDERRELQEAEDRAIACSGLARCHDALGDRDLAQTYLTQLVRLCKDANQHYILADTCARLGLAHTGRGESDAAADWYSQATSAAQKLLAQESLLAAVSTPTMSSAPSSQQQTDSRTSAVALVERIQIEAGFAKASGLFSGFLKSVISKNTPDLLLWGSERRGTFAPSLLGNLLGRSTSQTPQAEPAQEPCKSDDAAGGEEGTEVEIAASGVLAEPDTSDPTST